MNLPIDIDYNKLVNKGEKTDHTEEYWIRHARWIVTLSNGEEIHQDDDAYYQEIKSAWRRLALYTKKQEVSIVKFRLQFRDNIIRPLPDKALGYFFRRCAGAFLFSDTNHFYIVGHLLPDGRVFTRKFEVPTLILFEEEYRDSKDDDLVGESLITNIKPERIS